MFTRQSISIGKLLLNVRNYRIVAQENQKDARDAIIAEQGKKLVILAQDIIDNGLSPFDLPMVVDAEDGNQNFIVMEGNRRLTAIQLMLDPELAKDTSIHRAFVKLGKQHADAVPKVIDCAIAPGRKEALLWGNRKHASGMNGAGTEPWTAIAKARADKEQGLPAPALDVVNFVLTGRKLDADVRHELEGSQFNLTTLERLVTTAELQDAAGLTLSNGTLHSNQNREWTRGFLTEVVTIIARRKKGEDKWTERDIDTPDKRRDFAHDLFKRHPGARKALSRWTVSGTPKNVPTLPIPPKLKPTPSSDDRPNLIPKQFKLALPAGKINDVFAELKRLDVNAYRHAVSVLFRAFVEFTLNDFIDRRKIQLSKDRQGHTIDRMSARLNHVLKEIEANNLLSQKELKPIRVALSDRDSLLAPDTLNAYVHSPWMNPDPVRLKLAWNNFEHFVQKLWETK